MKLIIGLGNPGKEYEKSKHNIGFDVIDEIAKNMSVTLKKENKFMGEIYISKEYILLKPLTYMNLSGNSVALVMNFYKLAVDDIVVVYDDLDLVVGKIRYRETGSSGGHNGIKNIISKLGQDFKRIKIGIGRNDKSVIDQVLGNFSKDERVIVNESISIVSDACISYINGEQFSKLGVKYVR